MKNMLKKLFAILIIISSLILSFFYSSSQAVTLDLSYGLSGTAIEENSKNIKIYPGEEIEVLISINGQSDESKIMSIYGNLEYDKNLLEIVKDPENDKNADIALCNGWAIGNLNIEDLRFIVYTPNKERKDDVVKIKFKVKEECEAKNTTIWLKNIIYYDEYQQPVASNNNEVSINIPLAKESNMVTILIGFVVVIIVALILIILLKLKNAGVKRGLLAPKESKKESENNEVVSKEQIENPDEKKEN